MKKEPTLLCDRILTLSSRSLSVVVSLVLALAPVACAGEEEVICPVGDCTNYATTTLDLPLAPAELDGMRLEVCRNGICSSANLRGNAQRLQCFATRPDEVLVVAVECLASFAYKAPRAQFEVTYRIPRTEQLTETDQFTLKLTDASGSTTVAQKAGPISSLTTYTTVGPSCREDMVCLHGSF